MRAPSAYEKSVAAPSAALLEESDADGRDRRDDKPTRTISMSHDAQKKIKMTYPPTSQGRGASQKYRHRCGSRRMCRKRGGQRRTDGRKMSETTTRAAGKTRALLTEELARLRKDKRGTINIIHIIFHNFCVKKLSSPHGFTAEKPSSKNLPRPPEKLTRRIFGL